MAGHLLFNSGSNESSLAPQFKWLDNTFKWQLEAMPILAVMGWKGGVYCNDSKKLGILYLFRFYAVPSLFIFYFYIKKTEKKSTL
jgi:hypothetical protein